jgi:hypothetical protein
MGVSFQLQPNVRTAYRVESAYGVLPTNDSTARVFRTNPGSGLSLTKAPISANEVRADLQRVRDRHGPRTVTGSLAGDLSLSTFDPLLEAALRGTFSSPLVSASFASTYVASTGVWTRGTGSFVGEGYRVGDVVTVTGGANAGVPVVLVAVGTTTATIGNRAAWVDQASVAGVVATRPKKVIMPASPVLRSFSVEHFEAGASSSQRFLGCRVGSLAFTQPPDGMVGVEFGFTGQDMALAGTSYFAAATEFTSQPMVATDAIVCYNGVQVTTLSAASLSLDLGLTTTPVIGSVLSPNVFDGVVGVTGSLTFLKANQSLMSQFLGETTGLSLQLMYREVGTNGFICVNVPNFTVGSVETERIGPQGAQLETASIMVGVASGSDRDASMLTLCTSAT